MIRQRGALQEEAVSEPTIFIGQEPKAEITQGSSALEACATRK
jgi:hypothetical protein